MDGAARIGLDAFENAVLAKLLAGGHPVLAVLRSQAESARLASREYTGAGFYCTFAVPPDAPLARVRDFEFGDVEARIDGLKYGAGFVIFVSAGRLVANVRRALCKMRELVHVRCSDRSRSPRAARRNGFLGMPTSAVQQVIMNSDTSSESVLQSVVGRQLSAVTFVQDYIQLQFDGALLNAYVWPTVETQGRKTTRESSNYRNVLCDQIGRNVVEVSEIGGEALVVRLEGTTTIRVSLDEQDRTSVEAALFHDDMGGTFAVW